MSTDPLLQANKTSFEIYNLEEKRKRFCLNINTKSLEYLIFSNFNAELANVSSPFD